MSGLDEKGLEAAFDLWWGGSKYMQVVYSGPAERQIAIDAWRAAYLSAVGQKAGTVRSDEIVTRLYRRFKDWAARGFGPEDVTWCEVKADIEQMIALIPAPSVAEAAEAAEPVAFMDEEGNLFAKSNMPIAEILRALPTPPVGRKLLPLYTHPAPPPVVPSGLEALVERLRMLASGKAAVNSNGDVDARWFYGSFSDAADAIAALIAERDEAVNFKIHWRTLCLQHEQTIVSQRTRAETAERALSAALNRIAEIEGETIERCAKIAEERHARWRMPHPDDAKPHEVCDDISACADIAAAIRSSATKAGEGGCLRFQ